MSGLQDYHHAEDKPDKTQKMAMWAAAIVILGGITFYVVESGMLTHPQTATQKYPRGL